MKLEIDEHRMVGTFTTENDDGEETEYELPVKFEVCSRCDGKGSHVNPNIDGHGITQEEWERDWDEESRENYMSGFYDVSCYECGGKRVVAEIAEERLIEEQKAAFEVYRSIVRVRHEMDEEERMERRFCGDY